MADSHSAAPPPEVFAANDSSPAVLNLDSTDGGGSRAAINFSRLRARVRWLGGGECEHLSRKLLRHTAPLGVPLSPWWPPRSASSAPLPPLGLNGVPGGGLPLQLAGGNGLVGRGLASPMAYQANPIGNMVLGR